MQLKSDIVGQITVQDSCIYILDTVPHMPLKYLSFKMWVEKPRKISWLFSISVGRLSIKGFVMTEDIIVTCYTAQNST